MRITKGKIANCVSPEDNLPTLTYIFFNSKRQRLEATDGFVLATCAVELGIDEKPGDALIPVAAIKEAQRLGRAKTKYPLLRFSEDGTTVQAGYLHNGDEHWSGVRYDIPTNLTRPDGSWMYPDTEQMIPNPDTLVHLATLNGNRIRQVVEAVCESTNGGSVFPHFAILQNSESKRQPLIIEPATSPTNSLNTNNLGVIMPVLDERQLENYVTVESLMVKILKRSYDLDQTMNMDGTYYVRLWHENDELTDASGKTLLEALFTLWAWIEGEGQVKVDGQT